MKMAYMLINNMYSFKNIFFSHLLRAHYGPPVLLNVSYHINGSTALLNNGRGVWDFRWAKGRSLGSASRNI